MGGYGDSQFLAAMYAAGARNHMNGIGIHPYPITPGSNPTSELSVTERTLNRVRAVRNAAGDFSTPLYITEMGVSTQSIPGSAHGVSDATQASDLLAMVQDVAGDGDVKVALLHRLVDQPIFPGYPAGGYDGYGVFSSDGSAKPAACDLSLYFHGRLSCPG